MASGIAHDFNNTLVPMLAYSDLLLRDDKQLGDRGKARQALEAIRKAARSGASVVSRLNDFYRAREEDEVFGTVDLSAAAADAIELTQPRWKDQAQAKSVTIDVQAELEETGPVRGSEAEIRNLLTNLIFNAVDAMPGGGTIVVRSRREGEQVALEVSDTGVGMTEEVRQRAMEPFFSTKGDRGTGLGLVVVHGVVQRHGGTLQVGSAPGRGTSFVIRLPSASSGEMAPEGDAQQDGEPSTELRVLAVDDDAVALKAIAEMLRAGGHHVKTARSGREALERFERGKFDVVLTDRAMPGMNGDNVASSVKRVAPETPVIMVTGFGEMMETAGETPADVDLIVGKPFTMETLQDAMARLTSAQVRA